ncbi:acylneuraminate cytidylyltransferase family protein [Candidatus Pelagibacter sp.]|nr:acylneuraminate cytidylyltransferase family protein [Candidatus Pelagibacter sp.]
MNKLKIVAFIPARSGSKRLKNKNIKLINGEPLFYWTVKQAIKVLKFDKIIFSTDSKKYISILKKSLKKNKISQKKMIYELRSKNESNDKTKIFDYIKYKLINKSYLKKTDIIFQLLPTAPLRKISTINEILNLSIKKKKNIFSVSKYDFHVQFALEIKDKKWKPLFKKSPLITGNTRSQDQKTYYKPNPVGNSIWIKNNKIKNKTIYDQSEPFITDSIEGIDLDTKEDLILVRSFFNKN